MSYNCIDYNCTDELPDHTTNECNESLNGGISGIIVGNCGSPMTDPSNAAAILVEIAAGRAHKIEGIKVGLDQPSAATQPSNLVGGTDVLSSYNRTGTLIDGNVSQGNVDFYNSLFDGRSFGWAILFIKGTEDSTGGAQVLFIDSRITWTGGLLVPNNDDTVMTFNGTFAWRKKQGPTMWDAPSGIFS